ncbi:MAG: 3-dehydroquinate synthase [Nitrososphaerales archaeon]|nr:3-dehydroquinate synthase [Nitrososphaerales archaeon]
MRTVRVRVAFPPEAGRGYEVLIRDGILDDLAGGKFPLLDASSYFIVTDSKVYKLYGEKLRIGLSESKRRVGLVTFPAGEASKNLETAGLVASKLSKLGADRRSMLLALGGGVVGDLTGFVASIYKRGIDYIQLPTTLLAQVDSSIGGKTGIDTPWGKNQLGTFHQPRGVLTDPLALRTLPRREMLDGLAEIIKCAVIADRKMLDRLSALAESDSKITTDLIVDACKIKARVVSKDEKETNLRAVLNYGHTVGHAIESSSNYRLSHGTCVILGMMAESWVALRLGIMQKNEFEKLSELLRRLSRRFITKLPVLNKRTLFSFAIADKKTASSSVRMSLPSELGKMHTTEEGSYMIPVSKETFEGSIDYLREAFPLS